MLKKKGYNYDCDIKMVKLQLEKKKNNVDYRKLLGTLCPGITIKVYDLFVHSIFVLILLLDF